MKKSNKFRQEYDRNVKEVQKEIKQNAKKVAEEIKRNAAEHRRRLGR